MPDTAEALEVELVNMTNSGIARRLDHLATNIRDFTWSEREATLREAARRLRDG